MAKGKKPASEVLKEPVVEEVVIEKVVVDNETQDMINKGVNTMGGIVKDNDETDPDPVRKPTLGEQLTRGVMEKPVGTKYVMKKDKNEIQVFNGGKYVRTYTVETHGKDFDKLAKEFVSKMNNKS